MSPAALAAPAAKPAPRFATVDLCGEWEFHTGAAREGAWRAVRVPHTWQVESATAEYLGPAWYRRSVRIPDDWAGSVVRAEFEAVFHSAEVFVNGKKAGEHLGKGYTEFRVDLTPHLNFGADNVIEVRCDNSFSKTMLPSGNSYDWTPDGGIYRPARLLVTPPAYVERVEIDATPDLAANEAEFSVRIIAQGSAAPTWQVEEETTGRVVLRGAGLTGRGRWKNPRLWHFDHPNLYRLRVRCGLQEVVETFGVRKIEVNGAQLLLNGEAVRLMGVERMAGSHPEYGMAEPASWIEHDHRDMKELNCTLTRVHWMQDRRVIDFCDRHGILIQVEVPTWGAGTFSGMGARPSDVILNNGLEQLREMIAQNRNHPSVFCWGLCNEVGGHQAAAKEFARAMYKEAKRLDASRPLSYASNNLHAHTAEDVAGEMDILEWNDYYESWYGGTVGNVRDAMKKIVATHPNKPVIISEYGLCECNPKNPTGDPRRITVLREHDAIFREFPQVAGLIFFCYNDYRTHMGDKGRAVMRQRVHGVVDVYGARKPSFAELRDESSPVERVELAVKGQAAAVSLRTRAFVPCHRLTGYKLRALIYSYGELPMEKLEVALPDLAPGAAFRHEFRFNETGVKRVAVEVVRPTGYAAAVTEWKA
jgi:beta-glucuronidase